jgi:hypothetical protein
MDKDIDKLYIFKLTKNWLENGGPKNIFHNKKCIDFESSHNFTTSYDGE